VNYNTPLTDDWNMIIAVTDRKRAMLPFSEQIGLIAKARPNMLILAERDLSVPEFKALAVECKAECDKNGVELCIDKFTDVAKEIGVKAIHVSLSELREKKPEGFVKILTVIRSDKEAMEAEKLGATLLIFRDVFETSCKSCRNAKGLAMLRFITGSVEIPVVGAGGLMPEVFLEVLATDSAGLCMREGFMRTRDPAAIVEAYRAAMKKWEQYR